MVVVMGKMMRVGLTLVGMMRRTEVVATMMMMVVMMVKMTSVMMRLMVCVSRRSAFW
jgi:hypothetical protein